MNKFLMICFIKIFLLSILTFAAQDTDPSVLPKPLRIVGGYKDTEMIRVTCPERFNYFHQIYLRKQGGGSKDTCSIAAEDFSKYCAVVLAGDQAKIKRPGKNTPLTEEDITHIIKFIEDGGVLAISFPTYYKFLRQVNIAGLSVGHYGEEKYCDIQQTNHALVSNLNSDYIVSSYYVNKTASMISIAGDETNSNYAIIPVGNGFIVLMPKEVFPDYDLRVNYSGDEFKEKLKRSQVLATNLLKYLDLPSIENVIHRGKHSHLPDLVYWYREIPTVTSEGPEQLAPPFPKEQEILQNLTMDVGRTEWERRIFYTTLWKPTNKLSVRVSRFSGLSDSTLSCEKAEVLVLWPSQPGENNPNVFLGAPVDLPPYGENWLQTNRAASMLWCFRIHVTNAQPGKYKGNIIISADGTSYSLPVYIRVWPVKLDRRYFAHDVEYHFRSNYDYSEPDHADLLANHEAILDYYGTHWINWVYAGRPGHSGLDGTLRDGRDFIETISANPPDFTRENPPLLDLSKQDTLFHLFIKKGITVSRTGNIQVNIDDLISKAKNIYREDKLTAFSTQVHDIAIYWMKQYKRYLQEKGFPCYYTKIKDEWNENHFCTFLNLAGIATNAGWRVIANPSQQRILDRPEYRDHVWMLTGCWWYARSPRFLNTARIMEKKGLTTPSEFWATQTSSFWWNIAVKYGYRIGWELAFLDFPGHHWHGWDRGKFLPGGVFLDRSVSPCRIYPSLGGELLGEGLEEGQYLAMYKEMLAEAKKPGPTFHNINRIEEEVLKITGPGENSILKFKTISDPKDSSLTMKAIDWEHSLTYKDFFQAKRKLFRVLIALQRIVPAPGVDLKWRDIYLVKDGEAYADILYGRHREQKSRIQRFIQAKTNVRVQGFPVIGRFRFSNHKNYILIGSTDERWMVRLLSKYKGSGVTRTYPPTGSYLFYPVPEGNKLIIVGRDADGVRLGCQALLNFLELKKGWKIGW